MLGEQVLGLSRADDLAGDHDRKDRRRDCKDKMQEGKFWMSLRKEKNRQRYFYNHETG